MSVTAAAAVGSDGTSEPAGEVAAILVSYCSGRDLTRAIPSLLEAGCETWVVDNASDDGSAELIRKLFPAVRLIESPVNEGFAAANNRALERVRAEIVLLVNPDCELEPDAARALADHLRAHPEVGIVGPRIENGSGREVASAHRFETAGSVLFMLAGGSSLLPARVKRIVARLASGGRSYLANFERRRAERVDWVSGACLAARTDLLRRLGGLDQGYFMYMEDEDLCLRAWKLGYGVAYLPSAKVRHIGGTSSGEVSRVWPEFYRSLLRFQALTRPRTYPIVRGAVVMRAVAGIGIGLVRDTWRLLTDRRPQRRALAWWRILRLAVAATPARARQPWWLQRSESARRA